jgi:site-specific DNA-cytosine methylase
MYTAVDVMGFAGGFTLGMVQAGFKLVGKREMVGGFGVANCEANRHLLGSDWETEVGDHSGWSPVDADVVFGNPPCSGFSVMSNKEFRGAASPINHCMWAFTGYVSKVKPLMACFESVQPAYRREDGIALMRQLRAYVEENTGYKYTLYHILHNAYSVGGAAQRRRYFWLISRIPFGVEIPGYKSYPVLNDVIGDLSDLESTWSKQPYNKIPSNWASSRTSPSNMVDGHMHMTNPAVKRMYDLMEGIEWEPRDHIGAVAKKYYLKHGDLPPSWNATKQKLINRDFFMGFTTPVRWDGELPARVITGAGLYNVIHPFKNRMLTHREVARILGFPDDWLIEPLQDVKGLSQTWGKGITVDCGRWIGMWMLNSLANYPGSHRGEQIGPEEYTIDVTHAYNPNKRYGQSKTSKGKKVTELTLDVENTEIDESEAPKKRRSGRTPGQTAATAERDQYILDLIPAGGLDINDLVTAANEERPESYKEFNNVRVYMSLHRLRDRKNAVVLVSTSDGRRWMRADDPAASDAVTESDEDVTVEA